MKKFVVLLVVVAMTCFSAMAFAADVTVGGSLEVRSRDFNNLNALKDAPEAGAGLTAGQLSKNERDTQTRVRIDVNAKAGDVKGKLQLQNDFAHSWGKDTQTSTFETYGGTANPGGNGLGFREAWVNFNLPGLPVNVTAGHQLLTLANGWFFRSMHFGSDAWVVANQTGPNTLAFVNVKVMESDTNSEDDTDAYVLLDVFKLSDTMSVGADFTQVKDRRGIAFDVAGHEATLNNIGVNFNGKFGIIALKAEVDFQLGEVKGVGVPTGDVDFEGNQIVIQGAVGLDPVNVNFTLARGTGDEAPAPGAPASNKVETFINFLDVDPHYTFLHEYKVKGAAGGVHEGFANTTALGVGVSMAALPSLTVAADFWYLMATEDVALNGAVNPTTLLASRSDDLGMELDVKINWKLADNLAWNWTLGYFKPGDAYQSNDAATNALVDADEVTGIQGVLAFKF